MNPRVLQIPGSLIRQIAAKRRPDSIDLGLGEPTLMPTAAYLDAAMADVKTSGLRYSHNAGDAELRAAIAEHYGYPGMDRAENVCVTTGSQEAMYAVLKTLLDPATDELLVVEPAFPSYVKMAMLEGVAVRTVAMREEDDYAFDAERIVAAIRESTRAIVICSPCNPTARVLRDADARALVAALERRGGEPVWLIHDEIYREQTFVEDASELARLYPHTIVTNSLSKSNALTGLRIGWFAGPSDFVEQAIKTHAWAVSCADTFGQHVARHIFADPNGIREHAAWYAEHRAAVVAALRASGLRFAPVDGSFYACVRLPEGRSSIDAAIALVEDENVVTIPGSAFGACFEGWLRLSWVAPIETVRAGIERVAAYCARGSTLELRKRE
ncbi:MAG TPA: pyridoxal phosphate-dependent aminotransferase [Candidatus Baltobacteraceae bacterium]